MEKPVLSVVSAVWMGTSDRRTLVFVHEGSVAQRRAAWSDRIVAQRGGRQGGRQGARGGESRTHGDRDLRNMASVFEREEAGAEREGERQRQEGYGNKGTG